VIIVILLPVSPTRLAMLRDVTGDACRHKPQQNLTVPYDLPHRANGYGGSGALYWFADPIWSHLCGILATEYTIDKVVSRFRIETIPKFLRANEALLLP
jgi:hypothetical protein